MKTYIGVKTVRAEPEVKDGKEGYKVQYEEGYVSWCPRDVFERHNRETGGMPFSFALEALKRGRKVARKGWNGKGMWIRLFPVTELPVDCALTHPFLAIEYPAGHPAYLRGSCIPWLASQTDMLGDDWMIIEEAAGCPGCATGNGGAVP